VALSEIGTADISTDSSAFSHGRGVGRHYELTCPACGAVFEDDGVLLDCPANHPRALLNVRYRAQRLTLAEEAPGVFRYQSWLPIDKPGFSTARPAVYRGEALSRELGLAELWIAFHGYWPERGATFETGTFKELEADTVLARLPAGFRGVLTLASAGNTAAAFARACSRNSVPCLIVVPESGLDALRFAGPLGPVVRVVALSSPADYSDAIDLAGRICGQPGFQPEGGVFNVARRGGLGTVILSALEAIGRMPDYYFQAIGSGAGAIAVHQAAERWIAGEPHGSRPPRQMLSQNLPFAPIHSAWQAASRECPGIENDRARRQISRMFANVLSTRTPPYSIRGGVYDILSASAGDTIAVENAPARAAAQWFEAREGIDIDPASAVAVASLRVAVREARIEPRKCLLLNITGGGRKRRLKEGRLPISKPDLRVPPGEMHSSQLMRRILDLFDGKK